jgi:hypothetical protein
VFIFDNSHNLLFTDLIIPTDMYPKQAPVYPTGSPKFNLAKSCSEGRKFKKKASPKTSKKASPKGIQQLVFYILVDLLLCELLICIALKLDILV